MGTDAVLPGQRQKAVPVTRWARHRHGGPGLCPPPPPLWPPGALQTPPSPSSGPSDSLPSHCTPDGGDGQPTTHQSQPPQTPQAPEPRHRGRQEDPGRAALPLRPTVSRGQAGWWATGPGALKLAQRCWSWMVRGKPWCLGQHERVLSRASGAVTPETDRQAAVSDREMVTGSLGVGGVFTGALGGLSAGWAWGGA